MANIHYFPRYSQKENMVTNNTLLLFSRLYQNSPQKFTQFINEIFLESELELEPTVQFKQQEQTRSGSIPDGIIEQESFKVVIETKLYGQENIRQLQRHWEAFDHEDKQIFLWINKEPISNTYREKIITALNEFKELTGQKIEFAHTTFKEICDSFDSILQEYDIEMKALIADYEKFCYETKLIDNADSKIRVVLTGNTFEQNIKYNMYFHPTSRSYQNSMYLGLYKNKAVRAIGEISCMIDAKYDPVTGRLVVFNVVEGEAPEHVEQDIIKITLEANEKHGYSKEEERRFFIVEKFHETEYKKVSKGGLQNVRYIDLAKITDFARGMSASNVAQLLYKKDWDI